MKYAALGRTGYDVSEVSFGAWAIGGSWGAVDDEASRAALERAVHRGVNFFDTADVYGDGRSERLVGELLRAHPEKRLYVATKAGRRLSPHTAAGYTYDNLARFAERSLANLGVARLDLLQLHCPPAEVYASDAAFEALERLRERGLVAHYGVSVETCDEGLRVIERWPAVQTLQVIVNLLRQKPLERLLPVAHERRVGVLARVPLASGLLTGKLTAQSAFARDDHRAFNRNGEAFDAGETFSGVPYEAGLAAVERLRALVPEGAAMAPFALRWVLAQRGVTCVIPGAKTAAQVDDNCDASALDAPSQATLDAARAVYNELVRPLVHARW